MVLIVPRQDHDGLITYAEAIDAVSSAFVDCGGHPELNETRHRTHSASSGVRVTGFQAIAPSARGAGMRIHTEIVEVVDDEQVPGSSNPAVTVLYDAATSELRAVLLGEFGTVEYPPAFGPTPGSGSAVRTAATSAVAVDELTRPDVTDLGILGSGMLARNHLLAFSEVRDFERVKVFSPTAAHREAFRDQMPAFVDGVDIEAVGNPADAVVGADVVLSSNSAAKPTFDGTLLEPGQTVVSTLGSNIDLVESGHAPAPRRDVDDATVSRADVVVVNSVRQAREYRQGNLHGPVVAGLVGWDEMVPLRDVVVGADPGRRSPEGIVFYNNNCGESIADIALATAILEKVREAEGGREIEVFDPRG